MHHRRTKKINYFILYTILFLIMSSMVFFYFYIEGKSFVWVKDGWNQHFKALLFYSDWLQGIFRTLFFEHKLSIPQWSASIGYGSDIFTTLHYYAAGDPLTLFSVLVPNRYMVYFYDGMVLLRLYLAGLAFSYFCFYRKKNSSYRKKFSSYGKKKSSYETDIGGQTFSYDSVIAGAMIYIFCGFSLNFGLHHPFFINPMIYLPLLLVGAEKILMGEKPFLFVVMIVISAVSNFYFFYMLVLLTVFYVLFRIFMLYQLKEWKRILKILFRMGIYAVAGLCMSAVLLYPVLLLFFGGGRLDNTHVYNLLYEWSYYKALPITFLTMARAGNHTFFCYSSLALLCILILFMEKKKYKGLKAACTIVSLFFFFPIIGRLFNGFSYASNRWLFGYGMLIAYIVTVTWEKLFHLSRKQIWGIAFCLAVLCAAAVGYRQMEYGQNLWISLIMSLAAVFIAGAGRLTWNTKEKKHCRFKERFLPKTEKISRLGVLGILFLSIAANAYFFYSKNEGNVVSDFKSIKSVQNESIAPVDTAVKKAIGEENSFYRFSGDYSILEANSTLQSGLHGTSYYWSLSDGYINQYFREMWMRINHDYKYRELDSRSALDALASVKYYVTSANGEKKKGVPFYYLEKETCNVKTAKENIQYTIYENQNPLPLGYTYERYITRGTYEKMNAAERQNALLQGVLVEKELPDYQQAEIDQDSQKMKCKVSCGKGITKKGKTFVVKKRNAKLTLTFSGMENSETYLLMKNLQLKLKEDTAKNSRSSIQITVSDALAVKSKKTVRYLTAKDKNYNNRHDFLVNLGYGEEKKVRIEIQFGKAGMYSFEDFAVICQPMEKFNQKVDALKENILEDVKMEENQISGQITLDKKKILCLSIPYSKGWSAWVDGKKTEILQANTMFMAIPLAAGQHQIVLHYQMPGFKIGMMISLAGLLLFLGLRILKK